LLWFLNGVAESLDNPFRKDQSTLDTAEVQVKLNIQLRELIRNVSAPTPSLKPQWRQSRKHSRKSAVAGNLEASMKSTLERSSSAGKVGDRSSMNSTHQLQASLGAFRGTFDFDNRDDNSTEGGDGADGVFVAVRQQATLTTMPEADSDNDDAPPDITASRVSWASDWVPPAQRSRSSPARDVGRGGDGGGGGGVGKLGRALSFLSGKGRSPASDQPLSSRQRESPGSSHGARDSPRNDSGLGPLPNGRSLVMV